MAWFVYIFSICDIYIYTRDKDLVYMCMNMHITCIYIYVYLCTRYNDIYVSNKEKELESKF